MWFSLLTTFQRWAKFTISIFVLWSTRKNNQMIKIILVIIPIMIMIRYGKKNKQKKHKMGKGERKENKKDPNTPSKYGPKSKHENWKGKRNRRGGKRGEHKNRVECRDGGRHIFLACKRTPFCLFCKAVGQIFEATSWIGKGHSLFLFLTLTTHYHQTKLQSFLFPLFTFYWQNGVWWWFMDGEV